MTTSVTVKACSWPIKVTLVDRTAHNQSSAGFSQRVVSETTITETVAPFTSREFHVHSTRSMAVEELPLPPATTGS